MDPEINIKSRFFADDRPISAELETVLDSDRSNIQLWLKLAFYHLTREYSDKAECIDRALNVLSRGLESNRSDQELWETYLVIYASRVPRADEPSDYKLLNICERAIEFCPTYKIFRLAISLCFSFRKKMTIAIHLINHLCAQELRTDLDHARRSQHLVETVIFICQMLMKVGFAEIAIETGFRALGEKCHSQSDENLENRIKTHPMASIVLGTPNIIDKLLLRDLIFARLSFLHLRLYERFPETRIRNSNYTISRLVSSFPIAINLPKRGITLISHDDLKVFFRDYPSSLECIESWKANQEPWYSQNTSMYAAIEILHETSQYSEDPVLIYGLTRLHFYDGDFASCSRELTRLARWHLKSCDAFPRQAECSSLLEDSPTIKTLIGIFASMLHLTTGAEGQYQIGRNNPKACRSPILWLSLIMCCKMDAMRKSRIEDLYDQAITCCSIPIPDQPLGLRPLIFDYVKYLTESLETEVHFAKLFSTVRNLCLTLPDEDLQVHLIEQITRIITSPKTRLVVLLDLCLLLTNNSAILPWTLRLGLDLDEKDLMYEVLIYIILESDYQLSNLNSWCWDVSLALSIEKGDHHRTHQIFRVAISYDPYNMKLWKMMKAYEKSVCHFDHVDVIEKAVTAKLEIKLE